MCLVLDELQNGSKLVESYLKIYGYKSTEKRIIILNVTNAAYSINVDFEIEALHPLTTNKLIIIIIPALILSLLVISLLTFIAFRQYNKKKITEDELILTANQQENYYNSLNN